MSPSDAARIVCFFDGACAGNQYGQKGPMRAAYVIGDEEAVLDVPDIPSPRGPLRSNNIAEYHGLIGLLDRLRSRVALAGRETGYRICGDSQLVIRQMMGQYRVKEHHLVTLNAQARALSKDLPIEWRWVPRETNRAGQLLERRREATRGLVEKS